MKIIVVHSGTEHEVLLLTSILIGLKKKYGSNSRILWVGDPEFFCLVKYNKRVKKCLNINHLWDIPATNFYESEICINISLNDKATKFTSICGAKQFFGFTQNGPVDGNAEFAQKIIEKKLRTNKTALDIYYNIVGMKWKGEGYGLSYYPRLKQSKNCGSYTHNNIAPKCEEISLPDDFLSKFDAINQYSHIFTDDIFCLHAGLALRKQVTFLGDLPYKPNFT